MKILNKIMFTDVGNANIILGEFMTPKNNIFLFVFWVPFEDEKFIN